MARTLRVQYPGAIYHVMHRGDHLQVISREEKDAELFLATLAEACGKTDCQGHAFCFMSNHFHLVLVKLNWIAHHLHMGAPGYLGNCLQTAKAGSATNVRP